MPWNQALELWGHILVMDLLRYLAPAGLAFALFWGWGARSWARRRRLQPRHPGAAQMGYERTGAPGLRVPAPTVHDPPADALADHHDPPRSASPLLPRQLRSLLHLVGRAGRDDPHGLPKPVCRDHRVRAAPPGVDRCRPGRVGVMSPRSALDTLLCAALAAPMLGAGPPAPGPDAVRGRWRSVDDRTGRPRAIIHIRVEAGELRGRIERLYLGSDESPDPICDACSGWRQGREITGMEILWGFRFRNGQWKGGRVLDPENGKEYRSRVWLQDADTLKVRGYWGPFHRTQTWHRAKLPAAGRVAPAPTS